MKIYIIGHKSPDLDAAASTITYLEFLQKMNKYNDYELVAAVAEPINKETKFILEKFGVEEPKLISECEITEEDKFILVDHNEDSQRSEYVVNDNIVEVVDHHKINVNFTKPVHIDVRPLGSTNSVIYDLFEKHNLKPTNTTAQLILASILSDTQGLKSSTTTGYDSDSVGELAEQTGEDVETLTFEIFKAKSDLTGLSAHEIATNDYKKFEFGDQKVFINQVETVEQQKILDQKADLIEALNKIKQEMEVDQAFIAVTDILKVNTKLIYTNQAEEDTINKAFITETEENVADIGPKMSRKKDIAPAIEKAITG